MKNACKILAALSLAFATVPSASAGSDEAMELAAKEIVRVLKTQGPPGMQTYVQTCYAQQGENLMCLYLDTGASQISNYMAGAMNKPRDPFFIGAPYAQRIAPVMKAAGITPEQQAAFLKHIYTVQRSALYAAYVAK